MSRTKTKMKHIVGVQHLTINQIVGFNVNPIFCVCVVQYMVFLVFVFIYNATSTFEFKINNESYFLFQFSVSMLVLGYLDR